MTLAVLEPEIQAQRPAPASAPTPPPTVSKAAVVHIRKPKLPALTGIRTLLAIFIILFHFTPPHLGPLYPIIDNAYVFVGFFFLLSGFVLTYNYSESATTLSKREFWLARMARLYPVYVLVLAISAGFIRDEWYVRSHEEFWRGIILTPFLLQGWSPELATFGNTVAWTLCSEFMFYLAFPFLLYAWATRMHWLNTRKRLIALFFTLWVFGILPHLLYTILNPDHLAAPADRYTSTHLLRFLKYTPAPYVCTFLAGVTLAKLHPLLPFTSRQRLALASFGFAILAVFFYTEMPAHTPYLMLHGGLLVPIFSIITLGLAGPHIISSLFSIRPLVLLGEASFALYLLHFNVYTLLHNYQVPERLHLAAFDPWLSYVLLLVIAYAAFRLVEQPSRKAILKRFSRKNQHRQVPASTATRPNPVY
jgi:peptidoglycan/LPS O-acetylase OafA/YrhL